MTPKSKLGLAPNKFFMAIPFIRPLREWLSQRNGDSSDSENGFSSTGHTPSKPNMGKTRFQYCLIEVQANVLVVMSPNITTCKKIGKLALF
ncbi:hypothetical protein llap_18570 [Limosa lapponica baueri]|uniref:Uncharacterized protein n=1 Tax=Limosa lapponica baueri TaxID=1758121 RepID=A0A2I0TBE9_LIMLA|nr:hypothetical protein llap_18570 [Limosa lapponica baueri]